MMMTMVNMTEHPPPSTHAATSLHPLLLSFSLLLSLYLSPLFLLLLLPPLLLPLLLLFLLPPLFLALAKQKVKVKVRVLGPAREKRPQRAGKGKKRPERAGRCLRRLRAVCGASELDARHGNVRGRRQMTKLCLDLSSSFSLQMTKLSNSYAQAP